MRHSTHHPRTGPATDRARLAKASFDLLAMAALAAHLTKTRK